MAFWLRPEDAAAFEHLTTPALAQALPALSHPEEQEPLPVPGSMFAAGALFAAQPAALAVLRAGSETSAELLSLVVAEPFRSLGLARELLGWVLHQAMAMGWQSLSLSYPLHHGSTAAMAALTDPQLGWQWMEGLRLVHLDRDGGQALVQRLAPLVQRLQRSQRFSLMSWDALAPEAQQQLGQQLQAPRWAWPVQQSPDAPYACLDAGISTVMLDQGTPVGWLIAHRVGASLFRVTQWWVAPVHQGQGTGLLLLEHAVRQALAVQPEYNSGCFGVAADNGPMLGLCGRQLEPLASHVQANRRCLLSLAAADARAD